MKRYGDNGFPCLNPHWGTKLEVGFPSIRIEKETMVTHLVSVDQRHRETHRNKSIQKQEYSAKIAIQPCHRLLLPCLT
jgi:hypothetical protein